MAEYVAKFRPKFDCFVDQLDKKLAQHNIPGFNIIQERFGVRPAHAALGGVAVLLFFMLTSFGANALTKLVGFLYPVYASFRAIKTVRKDDDTHWLTYWIVYGFFATGESISDGFFCWIPLYNLVKCSFLVWMFLPQTQGASVIYNRFLEPFLVKHEDVFDARLSEVKNFANQMTNEVVKPTAAHIANKVSEHALDAIASTLRSSQAPGAPQQDE